MRAQNVSTAPIQHYNTDMAVPQAYYKVKGIWKSKKNTDTAILYSIILLLCPVFYPLISCEAFMLFGRFS